MERNGIHIIDLYKTAAKVEEAANALKSIAKSGKKVLFVATKKQAKQVVAEKAQAIGMPYVIERWPGGMLTNFPTIRKAVKKMASIDKMSKDGTLTTSRSVRSCRSHVSAQSLRRLSARSPTSTVCRRLSLLSTYSKSASQWPRPIVWAYRCSLWSTPIPIPTTWTS